MVSTPGQAGPHPLIKEGVERAIGIREVLVRFQVRAFLSFFFLSSLPPLFPFSFLFLLHFIILFLALRYGNMLIVNAVAVGTYVLTSTWYSSVVLKACYSYLTHLNSKVFIQSTSSSTTHCISHHFVETGAIDK